MGERNAEKTKNAIWIVAKKELRLLFKSKRRIFLLTITPLMILLIGVVAVGIASTVDDTTVDPVNVWVVNESPSNYTNQLLSYYQTVNNTDFSTLEMSYSEASQSSNLQVLVYFPANFTELVESKLTATVAFTYNSNSSRYQNIAIQFSQLTTIFEQNLIQEENKDIEFNRLQTSIDQYQKETGGISTELANSLFIIPVYVIFFVVIPPISLVMISVTIEREEKTLETLFLQPVTRNSIIMGKIAYGMGLILSILILDIIAAVIDFILISVFIDRNAGGEINDILDAVIDTIGADLLVYFMAVIFLISISVVALSVLLSLIAKDEREANLISGILPMAIFSIIFLVQIFDINGLSEVLQVIISIVPVIGILVALYLAMVAGSINLIAIISAVAQVIWIGLIIIFTARLSESESILELNLSTVTNEILRTLRLKK